MATELDLSAVPTEVFALTPTASNNKADIQAADKENFFAHLFSLGHVGASSNNNGDDINVIYDALCTFDAENSDVYKDLGENREKVAASFFHTKANVAPSLETDEYFDAALGKP